MNYTEEEIGHMTFAKYRELFEQHKLYHNMIIQKMLYATEEEKGPQEQEKEAIYF